MGNIFKRLARSKPVSLSCIDACFDAVNFDKQLSHYENQLYAGFTGNDSMLQLPSSRYQYLAAQSKNNKLSMQVLLSAGVYLSNVLTLLRRAAMTLMDQHSNRGMISRMLDTLRQRDPNRYLKAYTDINKVYPALLREAAGVSAVISARVNQWYCAGAQLELSGKYKWVPEESYQIFSKSVTVMGSIQVEFDAWRAYSSALAEKQLGQKDIDVRLSADINTKQVAVQEQLMPLGLSTQKIIAIASTREIFLEKSALSSKTQFLQLDFQRLMQQSGDSYVSQWQAVNKMLTALIACKKELGFIYRGTRKAYQKAIQDLSDKPADIARLGLKRLLLQTTNINRAMDLKELLNRPNVQRVGGAMAATVSPNLPEHWNRVMSMLTGAQQCTVRQFQESADVICQTLSIEGAEKTRHLSHWVTQFVAPKVSDASDPGYPLVYRYAKTQAHQIMQPSLQDVVAYLASDEAWGSKKTALSHLAFLIAGENTHPVDVTERLEIWVESLMLHELFVGSQSVAVWQRLQWFADRYQLKSTTQQLISFFLKQHRAREKTAVTAGEALKSYCLDQFQLERHADHTFEYDDWLYQMKLWCPLLYSIQKVALEVQHPYYEQSKAFLNDMLNKWLELDAAYREFETVHLITILEFFKAHKAVTPEIKERIAHVLANWLKPRPLPVPTVSFEDIAAMLHETKEEPLIAKVQNGLGATILDIMANLKGEPTKHEHITLLIDMPLTRQDLSALIDEQDASYLKVIAHQLQTIMQNKTTFVKPSCRKQAALLKAILFEQDAQANKNDLVDQYLTSVSTASQQQLFSGGASVADMQENANNRQYQYAC